MSKLRGLILNHQVKTQPIDTPYWSEKDPQTGEELVDGHIALQDIPASELMDLQEARKDGKLSMKEMLGALLVKSLIDRDTKEPVFQETDRGTVIARGQAELMPLFEDVQKFFGISKNSNIEDVKKNLETTQSDLPGLSSAKDAYIKQ